MAERKLSTAPAISAMLARAVECIREGAVIAFPTETYYGLAVDPFNREAVVRLFHCKRRPLDKPLLVLIDRVEQLPLLVRSVPEPYLPLMRRYWPGPLTLIFPARQDLCVELTGNSGTIAIRISSHPLARELVRLAAIPLTATSANLSGQPAPTTVEEVKGMFPSSLGYILDGGTTPGGLSSTVVGLEGQRLIVHRQGPIRL